MGAMAWLADLVVLVHLAFVAFVAVGGFLVLRWPRIAWLHIPAAIWGAGIELTGGICPLTPLENALREQARQTVYEGDFVARYLLPVLYPAGLTRDAQLALGATVIVVNLVLYAYAVRRARLQVTR
jgi:hypothetical protein